jgi:hypothetical protein
MGELFADMGYIRWPLSFSLLMVVALTVWSAVKLFGSSVSADAQIKAWVDAILFWGGFAMISGVLGTVLGIVLAAQTIELAGSVTTTLLWGGIKVALLSTVWGTMILATAALAWFVLQMRWRLLVARRSLSPAG